MIFSRIVGGLGNQLFQTAACLKYRNQREKVIISFLGDIHVPKRRNCLNYIFERPTWLHYDSSKELNILKKIFARTSAYLRFGSYLPFISINDRNFSSRNYLYSEKKILFLEMLFLKYWICGPAVGLRLIRNTKYNYQSNVYCLIN